MRVKYLKRFIKHLNDLGAKIPRNDLNEIKKVINIITNSQIRYDDFHAHVLGKYCTNKRIMWDCHPLYKTDRNYDLVILYSVARKKGHDIIFHDIGTHNEVFSD